MNNLKAKNVVLVNEEDKSLYLSILFNFKDIDFFCDYYLCKKRFYLKSRLPHNIDVEDYIETKYPTKNLNDEINYWIEKNITTQTKIYYKNNLLKIGEIHEINP